MNNQTLDWTHGGEHLVFQQCKVCLQRWYFRREFCPACGDKSPVTSAASGAGTVHASTLVQRAPSDEFRAVAPYRLVLVDLQEGVRVMGHADAALAIGDRVRCCVRTIAGRPMPYFNKDAG